MNHPEGAGFQRADRVEFERSLRRLLIIGANSLITKRHVHAAARPDT